MGKRTWRTTVLLALVPLGLSVARAADSKVYVSWEAGQVIQRMNLDGSSVENVVTGESPFGMDVDPIGRKIYWLAPSGIAARYILRRSDLDGTNVETIWPTGDTYQQFRIDPYHAKIYYSVNAADRIWRANLDGTSREALVHFLDASPAPNPRALAIDVRNDRLYWTNATVGTVQYTHLAGTAPVVSVATGGTGFQSGIDVDPVGGRLYWKDGAGIWTSDLDVGGMSVTIPPPAGAGSAGNNNLRLDLANGDVYWAQQSESKIWRCHLASCVPQQIGTLTDVRSLALLLPCHDPIGVDGDGDGVPDLCDNCALEANAEQSDLDGDGEGDFCDADDGQITVWFGVPAGSDDLVRWDPEFGPFWNVYRSDLATIVATGVYTQPPGSHPAADRFCDRMSPSQLDGYVPGPGEVASFLVTGYDNGLETDPGDSGGSRPNDNPCP